MNNYYDKLVNQFAHGVGLREIDVNSSSFNFEFGYWLERQFQYSFRYQDFLLSLNIPYNNRHYAEVGKGHLDTAAVKSKMTVISPYTSLSKFIPIRQLHNASLSVSGKGVPTGIYDLGMGTTQKIIYPSYAITTFMTHNPYSLDEIKNWGKLPLNNQKIIVGNFGSIFDCDVQDKIKELRRFKETIVGDVEEHYEVDRGAYYHLVRNK